MQEKQRNGVGVRRQEIAGPAESEFVSGDRRPARGPRQGRPRSRGPAQAGLTGVPAGRQQQHGTALHRPAESSSQPPIGHGRGGWQAPRTEETAPATAAQRSTRIRIPWRPSEGL